MLRRQWSYWLIAMGIGACADEGPQERFIVRDSANVPIAWSQSPQVADELTLPLEPVAVIEPEFASPEHVLFNVRDAAILSDERIVVANSGTSELYFFSPRGEFLQAFGGPGEGPGEFQRLFGLHACGDDRLVVEELSRLSIVEGRSATFQRHVQLVGHLARTRVPVAGVGEDCTAALLANPDPPSIGAARGAFDSIVNLFWSNFATSERDSLGSFVATELYPWEVGGRPVPIRAPYGRNAVWTVHPDGVVYGSARDASYQVLGAGGRVVRIVRWAAPLSPITDADWEHFERTQAELIEQDPREAQRQPPPGYLPRPHAKPAYAAIDVDAAGRVWMNQYGRYSVYGAEPSSSWSVFSAEGDWLADVRIPEGVQLLALGDSILVGVARDELDLERIQIYRMRIPDAQ